MGGPRPHPSRAGDRWFLVETTPCRGCGARLAPGLELCLRCYTPTENWVPLTPSQDATPSQGTTPSHDATPVPERPPWNPTIPMYQPEAPVPDPLYSRWHEGATTFGPTGRLVITGIAVLIQVAWFGLAGVNGVMLGLSGYLACTVLSVYVLAHTWKRDRFR